MEVENLKETVGNIDIYVLDQILKGRYNQEDKILDAGCGSGRNIHWFYHAKFKVWGVDRDKMSIEYVKKLYPRIVENFESSELSGIPFAENLFDHIICSAVLHFATGPEHFRKMFSELIRVLKPNGSILIRMASNIGVNNMTSHLQNGVYRLGDGTDRFLLTKELLRDVMENHKISFLEPLKTTNVSDLRYMSTLVLQKNSST